MEFSLRPRVLLVSLPGGAATRLASSLSAAGYEPVLANDFASAAGVLNERPDLLVADVKLGAHNGLHLAIRAAAVFMPAIVIGDPDPVLESAAERLQAIYLTRPVSAERVLAEIPKLLDRSRRIRRFTRKQVPRLDAFVDDLQARLLDVSHDGMRIESDDPRHPALPARFVVRLPQFNFTCRVQRVWTAPAASDLDETATWCGASVEAADTETARAWRALVDALPSGIPA